MSLDSLTAAIKDMALSADIDLVGITSVDRYAQAPKGRHPRDILPQAHSVISLGLGIGEGVIQADMRAHNSADNRKGVYSYMIYGYTLLNNELNTIALRISRFLEKSGYITLPVPASPPSDGMNYVGLISNIHAAVAAGLGEFGWQGLLVTPKYGPRLRTCTIVTSAPLIPDELYGGPKLCRPDKCGQICTKVCPTKALRSNDTDKIEIAGKEFEYVRVKHLRCVWSLYGLTKKTLALKEFPIPEEPTREQFQEAKSNMHPAQQAEIASVGRAAYCGMCIMYCPVGRKEWD
ncbi:MAG: hypothetical protein M1358_14620 [Chloroflexi bacterium]|nr:hypothetical protein [Chloroflexota bacterium]